MQGRSGGFGFGLCFSIAIITTSCKTEVEDEAKWQQKLFQCKENSDLYLSLSIGKNDLLVAFPWEAWGCGTLLAFSYIYR